MQDDFFHTIPIQNGSIVMLRNMGIIELYGGVIKLFGLTSQTPLCAEHIGSMWRLIKCCMSANADLNHPEQLVLIADIRWLITPIILQKTATKFLQTVQSSSFIGKVSILISQSGFYSAIFTWTLPWPFVCACVDACRLETWGLFVFNSARRF